MESQLDMIGKAALHVAMAEKTEREELMRLAAAGGFRAVAGQVGSMDLEKVVAAIETASRREGITSARYPEDHALYHAIIEALQGISRGQLALGTILRTVGLRFSVVRGPKSITDREHGEWIAVALYGNIGGPLKGNEHECVGLGMNHL